MKCNTKNLPLAAALLGFIVLLLRTGLYLVGTDEKGLLQPGHVLNILCWAVTLAAVVILAFGVRKLGGSAQYGHNFRFSTPAAIGSFALAGGIAVAVITGWTAGTRLDLIRSVCGVLAVPAMILVGLRRWEGKKPFFGLHAAACLYLTLYMVSHYQHWCSQPQTQDYFFSMAGAVCLTLFSYYQTAFDADMGKRRMQILTGLLAGFFCIAAITGTEDLLLYAGGALWGLTGLCRLMPVKTNIAKKETDHEAA